MATIKRFEDIDAWQKARKLLCWFRACSLNRNILDNIAEGFERGGKGEFIQFLGISKGSCGEVRSQLYRALGQEYLDKEKFDKLYYSSNEISKMIKGLITYLNNTSIKGQKYKK